MCIRFLHSASESVLFISFLLVMAVQSHEYDVQDFRSFIGRIIPLRSDGKIAISESIKHVKLDIGLSYAAPIAQQWFLHEDDLLVFGFEPNPASVKSILNGAVKQQPFHGEPLDVKFIGIRFFLIPCALGLSDKKTVPFYVTAQDCGCSSLYKPKNLAIERVIEVPVFTLADFFDLFPFDTHPVIDYIKIDAQGADFDIVKSAGDYIQKYVIYITIEPENLQYHDTRNAKEDIDVYMKSIGFISFQSKDVDDPTYINTQYLEYVKHNKVMIYQKG